MKIESKTLSEFLKKTLMTGDSMVQEGVLRFEENGLKFEAMDPANITRTSGWLKKTAFKEYEEIGNVGLNQFHIFLKILGRFSGIVDIKKEGNILTLKANSKKLDIELVSEEFLKVKTNEPNLEFKDTFTLPAEKLKDIFKDAEVNTDAIIKIETASKKVAFTVEGDYKFRNEFEAPQCSGGANSTFGQPLLNSTSLLTGMLEISVGENYPIKVVASDDTSVICIIAAPRVENETPDEDELESEVKESKTEDNTPKEKEE
ncbi:MAG: hypothetical protein ACOCUI_01150 [bacterium]